jgi:twitching motility protein PilT
VISQTLMPKVGGGRICAQEIMMGTDAVRAQIREGKTAQLGNLLQTGTQYGMQTLEAHLAKLVTAGLVAPDDACSKSNNPQSLLSLIGHVPSFAPAPAPAAPVAAKSPYGASEPKPARPPFGSEDFERFRQSRTHNQR